MPSCKEVSPVIVLENWPVGVKGTFYAMLQYELGVQ